VSKLTRFPLPYRLIIGFVVAVAIGWVVVSVLGYSELSGFFTMVVALAVGYVVMTFFLAADPVAADVPRDTAVGSGVATTMMLIIGLVLFVALPGLALADNGGDHVDGWPDAGAAAAAAAGAGAVASAAQQRKSFKQGLRDSIQRAWEEWKDAAAAVDRGEPGSAERKGRAQRRLDSLMEAKKQYLD
jgi:hypothetical protein